MTQMTQSTNESYAHQTTYQEPKRRIRSDYKGLLGLAEQGALKSRSDVLEALKGAGFEIARTTPKSISIKNPDGGQNIRLKE